MAIVAWDIETCPTPIEEMTKAQKRRFEKELRWQREKKPEMSEEEISRLVRSTHPFLGWICCISAVSGTSETGPNKPRSWAASSVGEEGGLLESFWSAVTGFPNSTIWATFNGKRFDVPFLLTRSACHSLSPSRKDLLDTYPYKHRPHADLARVWPAHCSLDGLCDLLSVPTPKEVVNGSQIADMVRQGGINKVVAYCEKDVVSTFRCLQAMPYILSL